MPRSAELEKKRETVFATLEAAANEAGVTASAYLRQMNKTGARDDKSYDGPQRPALEVDGYGTVTARAFQKCSSYTAVELEAGYAIVLSQNKGAKRANPEATAKHAKKRKGRMDKGHRKAAEQAAEAGVSEFSTRVLDGSRGGKGFHDHGGLTDATKDSPVVQEMREQVPPSTSSAAQQFAGRLAACNTKLHYLLTTRELPKDLDALLAHATSDAEVEGREDLLDMMLLSQDPSSQRLAFDVEAKTTLAKPLGKLREIGAAMGSFSGLQPPSVRVDQRASSRRVQGQRQFLTRAERRSAAFRTAKALIETDDGTLYHHAGKDRIVAKALFEACGLPVPKTVNVHRAIAVGLGRGANGSRRSGFSSDDGLGLGMETLGYELKLDHTHHGADDCCTQFIAWSPLIVALRQHYFGA